MPHCWTCRVRRNRASGVAPRVSVDLVQRGVPCASCVHCVEGACSPPGLAVGRAVCTLTVQERQHVSGVLAAPLSSLPSWTSSAASTALWGRAVRAPSAHCGTACSAAVDGSGLGSSAYGRRRRRTGNRATSATIRSTGLAASALRLSRNPKGCVNEAPPPPTETASMASERSGAAGAGRVISLEITVLRHRFCSLSYTVIFGYLPLSFGKTTDYSWDGRSGTPDAMIAPNIPQGKQQLTITLSRSAEKITVYCYHPVDNSTVIPSVVAHK